MKINILLFDNFETLDAFGPIEIFGRIDDIEMQCISLNGGIVKSSQGVEILTQSISYSDVILIPGGQGTRNLINNDFMINTIKSLAEKSQWCLTVCTGSALLAKTGLLDNRQATSNKRAWNWVISQSDKVLWQKKSRWCIDGKYYTSSGVSAGTDMALGFIADRHSHEVAEKLAWQIEYQWHQDKNSDPFWIQ
ncbi:MULTISPECIES: DJ-1/PfpI family protein [Gammaproteobacteria]|uniref:DJ-1/PfpI family protein n=1 Tax=Gammaproteobacteria TaxID=1236 RepID=UPI001866C679|nr:MULTISPECIES: DJ-1/PfpI family protein [Gammaproteobacteria]